MPLTQASRDCCTAGVLLYCIFININNNNIKKLLTLHNWNMLSNDNVSMSVGYLDHVLTVYSSMEHVTSKSLVPSVAELVESCIPIHACRCLPDPKCLCYTSGLSLCLYVDHFCLVPVDDMVLFHGMVCDGWLMSYTALPCSGASGLCTSCERVHFFLVLLDPQTKLSACLANVWAGAVLARDMIDNSVLSSSLTLSSEAFAISRHCHS